MREIKFRALDKDHNRMHYFGLFDIDTDYLLSQDVFIDEKTVMQYIGTKDKNGKEIYEGDIVSDSGDIGVAKFFDYLMDWDGHGSANPGFYCEEWFDRSQEWEFGDSCLYRCEVIGNIYENKELLKENK